MTETTLRDVFIGLILFGMLITSVFWLLNSAVNDNNITLETEYQNMSDQFKAFSTSSEKMTTDFEASVKEAPKGTFQTITDFFTRSIKVVTSMFSASSTASQGVGAVSTSWGFKEIPSIIWGSLSLILVALITFTIVSAWNRNKT